MSVEDSAIEQLRVLNEAINEAPFALCIYDANDRLVACSEPYRALYAPALDTFDGLSTEPKPTISDILSEAFSARVADEEADKLTQSEVLGHRSACCQTQDGFHDGKWSRRVNGVTSSGLVIGLTLSIDELVRRSETLSEAKALLEHQAYHDPLTDLPNRRAMVEYLEALASGKRPHAFDVALLHVDLDKFKAVNDTLGHDAGDMVICEAAKILKTVVRQTDFVARIGGDEFVVICEQIPDDAALRRIAERIVEQMRQPIYYGEDICQIGASIGIAVCETPRQIDGVLMNADIALYEAKRNGRGCFTFFEPRHRDRYTDVQRQIAAVREAVELNAFDPYFQPQVCAKTGRFLGVEALARWIERERGVLGPGHFLPAISEARLDEALDEAILRKSLQALVEWDAQGIEVPTLSVNVSAARLAGANVVDMFKWATDSMNIAPERLGIEILENVFVDEGQGAVAKNVRSLAEAGFRIALDDFGTGYASIAGLRNLALNRVKIDRSFVKNIDGQKDLQVIVGAMVSLAKKLDMEVLCEGVETPAELETVTALGCDAIQGFYIARPMSAETFAAWAEGYVERQQDLSMIA